MEMNFYTLTVYYKQNRPCFVVTIHHIVRAGVMFFETVQEADDYINRTKKELELFGELRYNENGENDNNYLNVIKTVLSCENIHIGENGHTFFAELD